MFRYLLKPRRRYRVVYRLRPVNNTAVVKRTVKAYSQQEAFELAKAKRPALMEVSRVEPLRRRFSGWGLNLPASLGFFFLGIALSSPLWVWPDDRTVAFTRAPLCPTTTTTTAPTAPVPVTLDETWPEFDCRVDGNGYCGKLGKERVY